MLLLSVSEAKVCSVDMDEMSLAEDDWEAEPDATSDTRENQETQNLQSRAKFNNIEGFSGFLTLSQFHRD
ncbi:hypothetical protein F2P81_007647 [Scophthalmus maximus]|uniref:Uncharacterized protein n=1 Tax=Scophthalmus maximus TaxID=52904 RepID=A0A6A4TB56_SCOMX|nr:hypothetical protein F2P81_007647 [Scophthalmus maximus]